MIAVWFKYELSAAAAIQHSGSPDSLSFLFLRKSCSPIHFLSVFLHESHTTRAVGRKKRFHQSTEKRKQRHCIVRLPSLPHLVRIFSVSPTGGDNWSQVSRANISRDLPRKCLGRISRFDDQKDTYHFKKGHSGIP